MHILPLLSNDRSDIVRISIRASSECPLSAELCMMLLSAQAGPWTCYPAPHRSFPEADVEDVLAIHRRFGQKPAKTAKVLPGVFVLAKPLILGSVGRLDKNDRFC